MPVEKGYGFECRKIRIASGIQKQWYEKFEKKHRECSVRRSTQHEVVYVWLMCGKVFLGE